MLPKEQRQRLLHKQQQQQQQRKPTALPKLTMCNPRHHPLPTPGISRGSPEERRNGAAKEAAEGAVREQQFLHKPRPKLPPPVPRQSAKPNRDPFSRKTKSMRQMEKFMGLAPKEEEGSESGSKEEEEVDTGSVWRQLLVVCAINLVTFLQGASLPTSSISTVVLISVDEAEAQQGSWPRDFKITEFESTMIGLSWLFGHLASGFLSNPVAELIGRRRSLALDAAVFAAGFFVYAAGESVAALCIGRVLLGYPLVSTVYMAELVHPELRGVAAAAYATSHALGYSLILLIGAVAPSWRYAVLVMGCLAVVPTLVVAFFVPESPVWLLRRGRAAEAEISLKKMRGPDYDVEDELEDLKVAVELNDCNRSLPLKDMLKLMWCKKFRLPFAFLFVLFLAVGWSGFTYLALNGVELFKDSNDPGGFFNEYMLNFLVSLIKIPGGLFAAVFLKKFPRRPVFLSCALLVATGHLLMAGTLMEIFPKWCALAAVTFAFFGYSAGYNSVAALLLGELLPAALRSVGVGLVASAEVVSSLSQTASAPAIEGALGRAGLFIIFAVVVFGTFVYSVAFMPETAGMTLEQIENIWQSEKHAGCVIRRDPAVELRRMSAAVAEAPAAGLDRVLSMRGSLARRSRRSRRVDGERNHGYNSDPSVYRIEEGRTATK